MNFNSKVKSKRSERKYMYLSDLLYKQLCKITSQDSYLTYRFDISLKHNFWYSQTLFFNLMLYYPEIEILKFPVEPHPSRLVECQQDKANWGSTMIVTSLWEQQILLKIFFSWSSVGKLYPDNKIIRTYANQNKNRNKNVKRQTENDVR